MQNTYYLCTKFSELCSMDMQIPSFNSFIENSIKENWSKNALTDYKGKTYQYHDVARKIEKLHILFEYSGVQQGDKIALCGRNSANWAIAYLATLTYGAVAVPIQHEYRNQHIYNIVNHSDAKLLFVGDIVATQIDENEMPNIEGIIYIPDYSLTLSRSEKLTYARENLNRIFGEKYPKFFHAENVKYHIEKSPDELAMINYTSGTTGHSKGVMIPYRALYGNLAITLEEMGSHVPENSKMLSILPMAHMYGLAMEFIFSFCHGCHLYFLTRVPSPTIIAEAFKEIRPAIVVSVPLVVEKIIRKTVLPQVQTNAFKVLMKMPMVKNKVKERVRKIVDEAFGGNAYEVIVGGASLNKDVESFLYSIDFPITVGYGTTETAPLITFSDYHDFIPGSCGTSVKGMTTKILSSDPENIEGEIVTKGINVMLGYYKDEMTTDQVIDEDGWYHTGDLGTMSADGHVFIRGRKKNMLLGSNGQNIYPEEIEDKLGSMAMVSECLVIQKDEQLIGLVHPDMDEVQNMGFTDKELEDVMEHNRQELNDQLPTFCKIAAIQIYKEEFEKTPKKSIKRYKYQN